MPCAARVCYHLPMRRCLPLLCVAALVGCDKAETLEPTPVPEDAGPRTVLDAGVVAPDAEPDAEPDAGPEADAGVEQADAGVEVPDAGFPDAAPPPPPPDAGFPDSGPAQVVRFVALGDTGEGNQAQYDVGAAFNTVCMVQGCDFVLLLGDNFYDRGVDSPMDDQFRTKFEEPYSMVQLPFYPTLGNHDFGEIPVQFWRTDHQIDYSAMSSRWNLPDHFYTFVQEHVTFISLDTNMIMLGLDWVRDQRDWIREQIDGATTPWIVAYGHHPYRSNGRHGNAGNYEGVGRIDPTGLVSGERVEEFFEDELCQRIDVYLAGHDHNRQWLQAVCGVELMVSGAGAKTTDLERRDNNPTHFEDDTKEGFFWIEMADDVMTVEIYDFNGVLEYTDTRTRRP